MLDNVKNEGKEVKFLAFYFPISGNISNFVVF